MKPTLYHYIHCPFCVRVRMTLGYLNIPFESVVLPYNDEATPVRLTGKKMLPILEFDSRAMNESLDIMAFLDKENKLHIKEETSLKTFPEFEAYLNFLGSPVHSLAMPYWIWTPEFNESSRTYFEQKKSAKRGPFKDLVKNQKQYIDVLQKEWPNLEKELTPFYKSQSFGLKDIMLASHIWGLYVVPEFQFPPAIHSYLQQVKAICHFDYHRGFWK
jgi:glutaredoxin 2